MLVKIRIEIGDPEIVGIADLFIFIHAWQTERKAPGALAGFGFDLINIERRIRHDVITATVQVMCVMVEGVRLVTGFDNARQTVHRHIHQAELCVIFHLLLPVEGHGAVGVHTGGIHKISALYEHTAAAARAIKKNTLFRFNDVYDHFYEGFRREEHTVIRGDVFSKFIEEVFIDASNDIAADVIKCAVIENTKKLRQQLVGEVGIAFRQNTCKLFALILYQLHGVVDHFTEAIHRLAVFIDKSCRRDIVRQIDEIFVLRLLRQEQCALCRKVAGLYRHYASAARGTVLKYLGFYLLKTAICIAQEDKPQNGHTVLV